MVLNLDRSIRHYLINNCFYSNIGFILVQYHQVIFHLFATATLTLCLSSQLAFE